MSKLEILLFIIIIILTILRFIQNYINTYNTNLYNKIKISYENKLKMYNEIDKMLKEELNK